jgi:hypothetical protein
MWAATVLLARHHHDGRLHPQTPPRLPQIFADQTGHSCGVQRVVLENGMKGLPQMQIFVHTPHGLTLENVADDATIGDLAAAAGLDDCSGWLEDADDELSLGATVAAVGDHGHLHLNRCKRIEVTIHFAGRDKAHRFAPSATVGRVRRWAVGEDGFDLPQTQRPKHEIGVCDAGVIADRQDHIGTLADDCKLCLDLAPKDRFQG